jgi:Ran GTPase-activating protein (RanGAP) involved in mRNA processing and transport
MWANDARVRKTLYLTGGMSEEVKLRRVHKAVHDQRFRKIHIVGHEFEEPPNGSFQGTANTEPTSFVGYDGDDDDNDDADDDNEDVALTLTGILADLLHFDERRWKSIKLTGCKGRADLAVQTIVGSTVSRLIIASTESELDAQQRLLHSQQQQLPLQLELHQPQMGQQRPPMKSTCNPMDDVFVRLGEGLPSNSSLLTLGFQNLALSRQNLQRLCDGLRGNKCLMELNFQKCRFHPEAVKALAYGLVNTAGSGSNNTQLHNLSFQHCRLTDDQIERIVLSLSHDHPFLHELNFEGNQCGVAGLVAIAKLLESPTSNLMVLDLASQGRSQPLPNQSPIRNGITSHSKPLDLTVEFCDALSINTRLTSLQLSDNHWSHQSMINLAMALQTNRKLRALHLAWCDLSSEQCMSGLAEALTHNVTLSKIILHETRITPSGLEAFSSRLSEMKGLKRLDIGGRQRFGRNGALCILHALGEGGNVAVEEIVLRRSVVAMDVKLLRLLTFYTDLNRAGRRFLRRQDQRTHWAGLWPLILQRAQCVELSVVSDSTMWEDNIDQNGSSNGDLMSDNGERDSTHGHFDNNGLEEEENKCETRRRISALYYLLRNGALLER